MNVREYLSGAQAKTAIETFRPAVDNDDRRAFKLTLRLFSKPELEQMLKASSTKQLEKMPSGPAQWKEVINPERLRSHMAERVLSIEGLTFGKLADLANLETPNGVKADWATKPVECNHENVVACMEAILGFEDWLLTKQTALAEETAREEARAKNGSAPTPVASTST